MSTRKVGHLTAEPRARYTVYSVHEYPTFKLTRYMCGPYATLEKARVNREFWFNTGKFDKVIIVERVERVVDGLD